MEMVINACISLFIACIRASLYRLLPNKRFCLLGLLFFPSSCSFPTPSSSLHSHPCSPAVLLNILLSSQSLSQSAPMPWGIFVSAGFCRQEGDRTAPVLVLSGQQKQNTGYKKIAGSLKFMAQHLPEAQCYFLVLLTRS